MRKRICHLERSNSVLLDETVIMKKIDLGQTINTIANLGVIAGIVLLAVEVGQNQTSLDRANALELANASTLGVQMFHDFRMSVTFDEQLSQVWSSGVLGEELSAVNAVDGGET
jgi:hypothetical protein